MKQNNLFKDFTKKYQLSKTLRFELIPIGETENHIKEKGLIQKDEERAQKYNKAKKLIDEVHKDFIEIALKGKELITLKEYYDAYTKPERDAKEINALNDKMRKEISSWLKDNNPLKDEKKLIDEIVPEYLLKQNRAEDALLLKDFKGFTTYFKGFNENRKNIYTEEEHSTAIAFRIVHENLPKFITNLLNFEKIKGEIDFSELEKKLNLELDGGPLANVFTLEYFNQCLNQSGIDQYNTLLGGKTEGDKKIQGVNELINLYRQKNKLSGKQAPRLVPLFKQILSDSVSTSYLPKQLESSNECIKAINDFVQTDILDFESEISKKKNLIDGIKTLLESKFNDNDCDLSKIFIGKAAITHLSQQVFGNYATINDALRFMIEQQEKTKAKQEKLLKKDYYSIEEIEQAVALYAKENDIENKEAIVKQQNPLLHYFSSLTSTVEVANGKKEKKQLFDYLLEKEKAVKPILIKQYDKLALIQDKDAIAAIKDYLDAFMNILHFIKPLYVAPAKKESNFSSDKDNNFYAEFDELYIRLNQSLTPLYNAVRSFLTRKPYSVEKVKLNFENKGLFLNGFVESVTEQSNNGTQYGGYLFRKKNKLYDNKYDYYLGVSNDSHLFSFTKSESIQKDDVSEYERLNYYQLKTNTIYGASYNGEYKKDKSEYIKEILKTIEQLKNPTFYNKIDSFVKDDTTPASLIKAVRNYCMENHLDAKLVLNSEAIKIAEGKIICKIKEALDKCSKRLPKAKEYADKNYSTLIDIQKDIDELVKEKSFEYGPVSKSEMETTVKKRELFLFQISNKDLRYSELRKNYGNDNLHTMYFKQLMSGGQDVYDIGSAEVFYRASSLDTTTVHSAGEEIVNKNPYNSKKTSRFQYAITKDKRYADRKYLFHLSIIQNNREKKVPERKEKLTKELNDQINASLKQVPEVNIIGIDRGEKNLAYWSLINSKGEIIEQDSFNTIVNEYKGESYETNYKDSLTKREKERDEARKSWNSVGKIKELKEGYLSQVVHQIAKMVIEHNAIVVFEDLNQGFKRGRMKVERQVYQKLEKMLIDKLNYLVFKNHSATEPGGVLNAYQLTAPFDGYKKMGKQTGAIYYIPAANTSKIDFATGFVNFLYPKWTNEKDAKDFFGKFEMINYNAEKGYFEFTARYNAFKTDTAEKTENNKAWIICTHGSERFQYVPSLRKTIPVNVTEKLEDLLGKKNIPYAQQGIDLQKEILNVNDASFFKELTYLLKLTLQIRYSDGERDFILSPVADKSGVFFNSEKASEKEPTDADANGAYHIALKGLMLLKRIKGEIQSTNKKKGKDLDLFINNKDWYEFVWKLKSQKAMQPA